MPVQRQKGTGGKVKPESEGIYSSVQSLLSSDKYADLTFRCRGRELKAHRAILCPQSTFFDATCRGAFKEAVTSIINLPDDDPEILASVIEFAYTGNYNDGELLVEKPEFTSTLSPTEIERDLAATPNITGSAIDVGPASLLRSLHIYVIADKFDIPPLKLLARQRFCRDCRTIAENHHDEFAMVVDELYETTWPYDELMREISYRLIAEMYYSRGWETSEGMKAFMTNRGDFTLGVLKYGRIYWESA